MDGGPPNDDWRRRFVGKALRNVASAKQADIRHRELLIRHNTLIEIGGGEVTLNKVITAAVIRAKSKSSTGGSLYNTWHQHVGTKDNVFREFREILTELGISTDPHTPLMIELENKWGTGYSLYFE